MYAPATVVTMGAAPGKASRTPATPVAMMAITMARPAVIPAM
jgi:hypothetical protein